MIESIKRSPRMNEENLPKIESKSSKKADDESLKDLGVHMNLNKHLTDVKKEFGFKCSLTF